MEEVSFRIVGYVIRLQQLYAGLLADFAGGLVPQADLHLADVRLVQQQHAQAGLADAAADGQGQLAGEQRLVKGQGAAVVAAGVKDELKKRLEKLTRREKKWTEMDAREKVRYVVRRMYKRAGDGLSNLTIREAASQLPRGSASEEEVASLYEQARYAETAPTQEQAERLRRDVKP